MVADNAVEDINRSIVDFFNNDPELSQMLQSTDIRENSMLVEILDKRRPSGFLIRGNRAEIVRGGIDRPTVKFTFPSKDSYFLMVEDIINGANVRGLITAMVFSNYPKIIVDPPIEKAGLYHVEKLLQIFEKWQQKVLGGGEGA